jgi:hypothetical protein
MNWCLGTVAKQELPQQEPGQRSSLDGVRTVYVLYWLTSFEAHRAGELVPSIHPEVDQELAGGILGSHFRSGVQRAAASFV